MTHLRVATYCPEHFPLSYPLFSGEQVRARFTFDIDLGLRIEMRLAEDPIPEDVWNHLHSASGAKVGRVAWAKIPVYTSKANGDNETRHIVTIQRKANRYHVSGVLPRVSFYEEIRLSACGFLFGVDPAIGRSDVGESVLAYTDVPQMVNDLTRRHCA